MPEQQKTWRIPRNLPPSWWVAVHWQEGRVALDGPHDSAEDAASDWIHEECKQWLEPPLRLEVVAEDPAACIPKFPFATGAIGNRAMVTARWNWFRRHRLDLLSWAQPKQCFCLVSQQGQPKDLFSHRLGGSAVLPEGHPWPTFKVELLPEGKRRRKINVLATFAATLDLRGRFSFGTSFPAAISIFLCTFDELRQTYDNCSKACVFANPCVHEGIVVPLFPKDRLIEMEAPPPGCQLDCLTAATFEMLDFPPFDMDLGEVMRGVEPPPKTEEIYKQIDKLEPGTSAWINIRRLKIGGYEAYIQHNLRRTMSEKYPRLDWHYIATWTDDRVMLGDSGEMYIVAGYDKKIRQWHWHCAWDCY